MAGQRAKSGRGVGGHTDLGVIDQGAEVRCPPNDPGNLPEGQRLGLYTTRVVRTLPRDMNPLTCQPEHGGEQEYAWIQSG